MTSQLETAALAPAAQPAEKTKPRPKDHAKDHAPAKKAKPAPKLHALHTYAGTVGEYGANPNGIYDRFTLTTEDGQAHHVKFLPHFGAALHAVAQPGQAATVLGYLHTTPKGDEHLHLARLDAAGQQLLPAPPTNAEPVAMQGELRDVLRDPQGQPRALRLSGEAAELRFPPHLALGPELTELLVEGATVHAHGQRQPDRPGELRAPGTQAPLQLTLLSVGDQAFFIR